MTDLKATPDLLERFIREEFSPDLGRLIRRGFDEAQAAGTPVVEFGFNIFYVSLDLHRDEVTIVDVLDPLFYRYPLSVFWAAADEASRV